MERVMTENKQVEGDEVKSVTKPRGRRKKAPEAKPKANKPKYEDDMKAVEAEQKGTEVAKREKREFTPVAYSNIPESSLVKVTILHHSCFVADDERAYKGDKCMVPKEVAELLEKNDMATT